METYSSNADFEQQFLVGRAIILFGDLLLPSERTKIFDSVRDRIWDFYYSNALFATALPRSLMQELINYNLIVTL